MPDCNKNIDEGKVSNERIHGARNVNALMTVTCILRWASLGKLQTRNCTMKGLYSTASTVDEWQRAIAPALVIMLRHRLLLPQIAVKGTETAASPGSGTIVAGSEAVGAAASTVGYRASVAAAGDGGPPVRCVFATWRLQGNSGLPSRRSPTPGIPPRRSL